MDTIYNTDILKQYILIVNGVPSPMTSVPSLMTTHVRRDLRELIRPRYEKTVYTVSVSVSMGTLYSLEKQLCVL